jgi:hypothetical protein
MRTPEFRLQAWTLQYIERLATQTTSAGKPQTVNATKSPASHKANPR